MYQELLKIFLLLGKTMIDKKNNFFKDTHVIKNRVNPKVGIVFIGLIILQSYLLPLLPFVPGLDINKYASYMYLYAMSSYTLIVLGIMIFQANGEVLFQDHFTLWIIVLSCFLRSTFGGDYSEIHQYYMNFLGFVLSVFIIANRKKIKIPSLKSAFIGLAWSVGTVVIAAILHALLNPIHGSLPANLSSYIINMSIFQLSFVTVIEETCFRGLILGFMVMNGYKKDTAFLFQAFLFWGGHYIKITNPALFFVVIPILTLSATLIIRKYNMLYLSIIMHTLNNVFGAILVALL